METVADDIRAEHVAGDTFVLRIREHRVVVDQPNEAGGDDRGPTPTELFVASLAGCVGFYAERYLRRHGLPDEGLCVQASFGMAEDRPSRVASIDIKVILSTTLPEDRVSTLQRVVDHCTVHESIRMAPEVRTRIVVPSAQVAA